MASPLGEHKSAGADGRAPPAAAPHRPRLFPVPHPPSWLKSSRPSLAARAGLPNCPELACVRHLVPPGVLAAAELRSAEIGVDADRVLIANGHLSEETYVRALAQWLGMRFEPMERSRETCPLPAEALLIGARIGMLRLTSAGVVAPALVGSRALVQAMRAKSDLKRKIALTTQARLRQFAETHGAGALAHIAVTELQRRHPRLSAAPPSIPRRRAPLRVALLVLGTATALSLSPLAGDVLLALTETAMCLLIAAWSGLRLVGLLSGKPLHKPERIWSDAGLPVYTIIAALHREVAALPGLVKAFNAFDYPREKLDIKLVLEPDDHATIAAVRALALGAPFETIIAPASGPRTKPKALNAALPFARGTLLAVYDAEDRPEADQLRLAAAEFLENDQKLACVQGRLAIDNTGDSWIARFFTAEYAGLFDTLLPGLAAHRLPLPLGGSSNHFRTSVLRAVHGWDPYNVTEDADLGMRLSRLGYRTSMIASTTFEEAPAHFGPWLRQRTRWFKGWMQTWQVHMRAPRRLRRDLGWRGFATFQLTVGGSTLAALAHLPFMVWLGFQLGSGAFAQMHALHALTMVPGYLISGVLGFAGLWRRRLTGSAWVLVLTPLYWLMLSMAAWRALYQISNDPYRWEKTEHGLARTSRFAEQAATLRDSGAGRPPNPPACA